jgi:hypothetical protein
VANGHSTEGNAVRLSRRPSGAASTGDVCVHVAPPFKLPRREARAKSSERCRAREKESKERKQRLKKKKQTDGERNTQCGAKDTARDCSTTRKAQQKRGRHAPMRCWSEFNVALRFAGRRLLRIGGEAKRTSNDLAARCTQARSLSMCRFVLPTATPAMAKWQWRRRHQRTRNGLL